jgi:alkylated DNA repair dioxygenase AlkB
MRQEELFASELATEKAWGIIPGLVLSPEYITSKEEHKLIEHVDAQPWETNYRRRIQQYGLGYSSSSGNSAVWLRDFPWWLLPLAKRVSRDAFDRPAENCVINEYIPPLGIGPHRDYSAFGPTVACVSLGSDIVMDFTEPEKRLRIPVNIPARSFWKISGEARSRWRHGIAERLSNVIAGERRLRTRRISITFRTGNSTI